MLIESSSNLLETVFFISKIITFYPIDNRLVCAISSLAGAGVSFVSLSHFIHSFHYYGDERHSGFSVLLRVSIGLCFLVGIFTCLGSSFLYKSRVLKCVRILEDTEKRLKLLTSFGYDIFYVFLHAAIMLFCYSIIIYGDLAYGVRPFAQMALVFYGPIPLVLSSFQFSSFLLVLSTQFHVLNRLLRQSRYNLDQLLVEFEELCDLCAEVNSIYGLRVLISMLTSFVCLAHLLYYIEIRVRTRRLAAVEINVRHMSFASLVIACLLWIVLIKVIVGPADSTRLEVTQFSSDLQHIILTNKNEHLLQNRKVQFHLFRKRTVNFTACDIFNIDNTLIHTMVAGVSTFLVILLQMDIIPE